MKGKKELVYRCRHQECPLDHCQCGTHDVDHKCDIPELNMSPEQLEMQQQVQDAERAAGWDPNP